MLFPMVAHHSTLAWQWAREWGTLFMYHLGAGRPLVKWLGVSSGGFHLKQLKGHTAMDFSRWKLLPNSKYTQVKLSKGTSSKENFDWKGPGLSMLGRYLRKRNAVLAQYHSSMYSVDPSLALYIYIYIYTYMALTLHSLTVPYFCSDVAEFNSVTLKQNWHFNEMFHIYCTESFHYA